MLYGLLYSYIMKKYLERVEKYEDFLRGWVEEFEPQDKISVLNDLEDFWYFRANLSGEKVKELDAEFLPKVYRIIVQNYPELADYFLDVMKKAGVDLSIFESI
jgi:hypothetical protein